MTLGDHLAREGDARASACRIGAEWKIKIYKENIENVAKYQNIMYIMYITREVDMSTKMFSLATLFERELKRNPNVKALSFRKGKGSMGYLYFRFESVLNVMLYVLPSDLNYFVKKGYTICEDKNVQD